MPEVGLRGAAGDDQAVVRVGAHRVIGPDRRHGAHREVEPRDLGQLHRHVAVMTQHLPDRRRHLTRGQDSRRQLIEQRLEEVVVPLVDQRHLHRRPSQELRSEQAPETATDDEHPVNRDIGHREHSQPRRSVRWSPTRRALAMAVSDGFTAPMLGKKLVSTTYRLSTSWALQFTSRALEAGSFPNLTVPAWWAVAPIGMLLCRYRLRSSRWCSCVPRCPSMPVEAPCGAGG